MLNYTKKGSKVPCYQVFVQGNTIIVYLIEIAAAKQISKQQVIDVIAQTQASLQIH
jgi:hypothetical protein